MFKYKEFSVLEAIIKINDNKMLNLTLPQGKKLFNEYRKRSLDKFAEAGKEIIGRFLDSDILDEMRKDLGIDFVLSDLYIRFAIQRKERLESKVPNVTVLVVRNPSNHIHRTTIKEILKGDIK